MNHGSSAKKKKKTSNLVWIIVGVIALVGIGGITYFAWPKKVTKTETKSQTAEEKTQQLQNQLSHIKQSLDELSDASEKSQITTQITDIEQKLKRISQQNNQEQAKVIKQMEEEIKAINQKIGIKDDPTKSPKDNPPEPAPQPDNNNKGWNYVSTKIDDNTFKYKITLGGTQLSFRDFIAFSKNKKNTFFQAFQGALKDANSKFPAYFWKCPPVSKKTLDKPFEFVVIKSESLNNITQNYSDFDDHLVKIHGKDKPSCISFPNNRKPSDAILVVPAFKIKNGKMLDYKNISQFTKNASDEQQQEVWQEVAVKFLEELEKDDTHRWLNTHGLGVHYLHVRIDEEPKYYGDYVEYKYL